MNIADVMTRDVTVARPSQSIREVAQLMRRLDVGSLPVGEDDRLIGMVTDRDIVIRAVADGLDSDTRVIDVMSGGLKYCYEYDDVKHVASNMAELQLRRLPVVDDHKRLVGIVSLSNMLHSERGPGERMARAVASPH